MRYAVKVAYDGSLFHGSQRQSDPDPGSVEGAIVRALEEIGGRKDGEWPVEFSSRTDSGVSAIGNVFAMETERDVNDLLKALNANMDGVWCWGAGPLREHQNIRWANSRWYRYHLPPGILDEEGVKGLNLVARELIGEHDFTHFCRLEEEKDPVTVVEKASVIDLARDGEMVVFDVVGNRFLWQQVRRMVGGCLAVSRGDISIDDLRALLKGRDAPESSLAMKNRIKTMPGTGLFLMDARFDDVEFKIAWDALELAIARTSESVWGASMKVLLNSAMRSLMSLKGR